MTYRLFPIARNQIHVRLENLADLVEFDKQSKETQYVNLDKLVEDLYTDEN